MNKKQLIVAWVTRPLFISILMLTCLSMLAYSSWAEYTNIRYMDLDGDSKDEIIIETKCSKDKGHYIEDMRIFKDEYPDLKLIFSIRTLDSYFGFEWPKNYNIVSEVEFTEQNLENGTRDIIVKSKKIYFKDKENKIIDAVGDFEIKTFVWDGDKFKLSQTGTFQE